MKKSEKNANFLFCPIFGRFFSSKTPFWISLKGQAPPTVRFPRWPMIRKMKHLLCKYETLAKRVWSRSLPASMKRSTRVTFPCANGTLHGRSPLHELLCNSLHTPQACFICTPVHPRDNKKCPAVTEHFLQVSTKGRNYLLEFWEYRLISWISWVIA